MNLMSNEYEIDKIYYKIQTSILLTKWSLIINRWKMIFPAGH